MPKIVLAYSGGLDTSYCAVYLSEERGFDVHAVLVDTGGFSDSEIEAIGRRARQLGAVAFERIDARGDYYDKCLRHLIAGNVLRGGLYPMSVSAERMFQALAIIDYANRVGATAIAHGSTGAGNDQVRFDYTFRVLGAADLEIVTPIRDQQLSREAEVAYLAEHGHEFDAAKAKYSINRGLWGTSVGGAETLTSHLGLPEEAWPTPVTATEPLNVDLVFEHGEVVGLGSAPVGAVLKISGFQDDPVAAIEALTALAAPYGVGRGIHVGDTIIGIKGRVGFEAPAATLIIKAHELLEKHTLSKLQQTHKRALAELYGTLIHESQFLDPVRADVEAFFDASQRTVTGTVHLRLHPHRFELLGVSSPRDQMQAGGSQYGETQGAWSGDDVRGFTRILANAPRLARAADEDRQA